LAALAAFGHRSDLVTAAAGGSTRPLGGPAATLYTARERRCPSARTGCAEDPEELMGTPTTDAAPSQSAPTPAGVDPETLVEDEVLVEEISIDGMCGVY